MLSESQNTEYKESWRDEYLKWICGFANAQGGKIYIGVNDDKEVIGIGNSNRLMEDIPNKIVMTLGIVCDVNLLYEGEKEYIEIVVEASNVPICYRGQYHYRSGSTKQELKGVALQQFILKKMGRSWDDIPMENVGIEAIDREAIDYFLKKGIDAGRIEEDERDSSTECVLENLNLLTEDGHLKQAAVLLFGKKPQKYFTGVIFQIGRFGADESDLIIQDFIEGGLIRMADRVMDVLKSKYLTSRIHFEGMQRKEKLEVSEKAMREILYNAIAHKDYTGAAIQMHVYDDRVEIWNEGELPEGYTLETLLRPHSSRPRNKNIAQTMFKAGFVDTWGRGYKKIREGFESCGLPMPTVESRDGGTLLTFQRKHVAQNVAEYVADERLLQLPERQRDIYKYIKAHSPRNVADFVAERDAVNTQKLADVFHVSRKTIQRETQPLAALGLIEWIGSDGTGFWQEK